MVSLRVQQAPMCIVPSAPSSPKATGAVVSSVTVGLAPKQWVQLDAHFASRFPRITFMASSGPRNPQIPCSFHILVMTSPWCQVASFPQLEIGNVKTLLQIPRKSPGWTRWPYGDPSLVPVVLGDGATAVDKTEIPALVSLLTLRP